MRTPIIRLFIAVFALFGVIAACPCPRIPETPIIDWQGKPGVYVLRSSDPNVDFTKLTFFLRTYRKADRRPLPYTVVSITPADPKIPYGEAKATVNVTFPILPPGMYTLTVRAPGERVALGSIRNIFVPPSDAAHDAAIRERYVGATVWEYGRVGTAVCDATPFTVGNAIVTFLAATFPAIPLRVVQIERATDRTVMMNDEVINDTGFQYEAFSPLAVTVDVPNEKIFYAGLGLTPVSTKLPTPDISDPRMQAAFREHCPASHLPLYAGDQWDLERLIALHGPGIDVTKHPIVGLTHEQVAFALGFPYAYATRDDMLKLSDWNYKFTAPNAMSVHFDGDRAVRYDPPGELP
jgi:hypothetical protein